MNTLYERFMELYHIDFMQRMSRWKGCKNVKVVYGEVKIEPTKLNNIFGNLPQLRCPVRSEQKN